MLFCFKNLFIVNIMTHQTQHLKKAFIIAHNKFGGNVSRACAAIKINRSTYYDWYTDDLDFKKTMDEYAEKIIDDYEDLLAKHARKDTTAVIFGLKCMGRRRGWSERIIIETPQDNRLFEDSVVNTAVRSALQIEKERMSKLEESISSESLSQLKESKKVECKSSKVSKGKV